MPKKTLGIDWPIRSNTSKVQLKETCVNPANGFGTCSNTSKVQLKAVILMLGFIVVGAF